MGCLTTSGNSLFSLNYSTPGKELNSNMKTSRGWLSLWDSCFF